MIAIVPLTNMNLRDMLSLACGAELNGLGMGCTSGVDPVITFLVALLRANYETTGVSSKKLVEQV